METNKNNKYLIKSKKQMFTVIAVFTLLLFVGGTTYAFFNYTRTGLANTLNTGRIYFSTEQTNQNTINLSNVFPMTKEQALADNSANGTLVVTFNGDTEYTDGMEYLLSIDSVTGTTNVPISLIMDVNITENSVAVAENSNYYTAREAKNTSMYLAEGVDTTINSTTHKVITDIETGKYLLAGYIKSGEYGINGSITIKAFIDADNILITDTPDDQSQRPSTAYTDGTDTTGKTVISTTDWNSLQSTGISFKVRGEAREGIWVKNPNTLYNIMKKANQGTLSDFSKMSSEDGTSGVYETTEGVTPIYYYRGAVDNNVKFGDYCWKAVRTTVTGGVKLIYNGEAVGNQCTTQTGTGTMINNVSNIKFNNSDNNAAYVGYTYIDPTTNVETDSNMKQVIDTWYSSAITNNKIDDSKVETTTYCNDRSVASTSGSNINYGAFGRLNTNKTPSLNCPNTSDNYSLKVGFITADEIAYAGGKYSSSNSTFYLNNNSSYWSGSPRSFVYGSAREFYVYGGNLNFNYVSSPEYGVRSVVSLVPGTAITSGDGTPTNPYIVG